MKIPFEEILPSDVHLYVGTQNSPNLSICGGVLIENVPFPPLTLKMAVKVIHFHGQNIKSYRTFKSDIWFGL
jgi:hypothetical protein